MNNLKKIVLRYGFICKAHDEVIEQIKFQTIGAPGEQIVRTINGQFGGMGDLNKSFRMSGI